ncbi:MAG: glucose 1-dehydrogenase [Bryobacterales bacterium]|nr:glucose 1-dehydrogenase [Bryobacterales bacterium]
MGPLEGRTALVTGASRGIGRATALRLARDGAAVAVNYRDQKEAAEAVCAEIAAAGGRAIAVRADVADQTAVGAMAAAIASALGPVDILVNNAGILRTGDLDTFDYSEMEGMRRVNVDGLVAVTRAVAGPMKKRGFGRIVNLTSIAALGTAMAGTTFYAATKAAVILLTRRFAMDLGPHGVTVNAVAPGFILTDLVTANRTAAEAEALIAAISAKAMTRRVGKPEDIAHAIAYLAHPESGFVTGQVLTVDGGRLDYIGHQ